MQPAKRSGWPSVSCSTTPATLPETPRLAVLLPGAPSSDLISLLAMHNIRCVCELNGEFRDLVGSAS